ncbi:MAG: filamentous hemagglutinin N-terminal domain-containing protein, partial [Deltaproteobacteria bacterium]
MNTARIRERGGRCPLLPISVRIDLHLAAGFVFLQLLLGASIGHAQTAQSPIVVDPSLGTLNGGTGEIAPRPDPITGQLDYQIGEDFGKQIDGNLFHSFSSFSVPTDQKATFTYDSALHEPGGRPAIHNVIARVTGREASSIDGTLGSTIPGANLFLMNPHGVIFGQGATLDVKGSFLATTADYINGPGFYAAPDTVRDSM